MIKLMCAVACICLVTFPLFSQSASKYEVATPPMSSLTSPLAPAPLMPSSTTFQSGWATPFMWCCTQIRWERTR